MSSQQFTAALNPGVPVYGPPGPPGVQISTQNNVTGLRSPGSIYQNPSTTLPLFVLVSWSLSPGAVAIAAYTDANNPPTSVVSVISQNPISSITINEFFIVLPGNFYMVQTSGANPIYWIEYQ